MLSYLIKPVEPTILNHKGYHELSSTDLLPSLVLSTMHVVPELLDVKRFNIALAEALSSFPLLAGRLVRPDRPDAPWAIRLTNSGVPVSVIDSDADEIFPTDLIIQDTFRYTDPLNIVGIVNAEGESNEPLFRLRITRFTKSNSTSIGASSSHVLYDEFGFLMFFKQLSHLYRGLGPIDPSPYYEPEAIKFPEPLKPPSPPYVRFDPSAPPPWAQPGWIAPEFIAFRLTDAQLTEINNYVTNGMEYSRINGMDTLVGLLARCLSEVEPEIKPIDTISYLVNHRGMGIYPVNAAANTLVYLLVEHQLLKGADPHDDVLACAVEIREALEKLKDLKLLKDMVADFAQLQSENAWDRYGLGLPKEGVFFVGTNQELDWRSPHFGHPGKTRFHFAQPPSGRFAVVMTPNPIFVDGAWISRDDKIEVTLYVPPNKGKTFEELLEGYAKGMGMTGSVEFVPQL